MAFRRKPPAENVRRTASSGRNHPGVVVNKTGRIVQYESQAEHILILCLDRDRTVRDYISQPLKLEYIDVHGRHVYVPDFQVFRADGRVELHTVSHAGTETGTQDSSLRREEAVRGICRERDWNLVAHTAASLPQATERANLQALFAFRPTAYANRIVAFAAEIRLGNKQVGLRAAASEIAQELLLSPACVTAALCNLLWHEDLLTDLSQLIFLDGIPHPRALVWQPSREGGTS